MNVEEKIEKARLVEANIKLIEKRHKEELEPYQSVAEALRNQIQEWMINQNMLSAKTPAGHAVLAKKTSYRVEDQQEFKRHVIGTESWELIVWAVKRSAAEAFMDATQSLPPGVVKSTILELRLLAPEKKRVHKSTNIDTESFDAFAEEDALADATRANMEA